MLTNVTDNLANSEEVPISFLNEIITTNSKQDTENDYSDTMSTISANTSIFNQIMNSKDAPPFVSSENSFTFYGPNLKNENMGRKTSKCLSEGNYMSDSISVLSLRTQGISINKQNANLKLEKIKET